MFKHNSYLLLASILVLVVSPFPLSAVAETIVDKRPSGCGSSLLTVPVAGETHVIVEDPAGVLWFGSGSIVHKVNAGGSELLTLSPAATVNDIVVDSAGLIWVAAGTNAKRYATGGGLQGTLTPGGTVNALAADPWSTSIWIGAGNQAYKYNLAGALLATFDAANTVNSLMVLSDGTVWVGSGNIVYKLSAGGSEITSFSAGATITDLLEDGGGSVWVAAGNTVKKYSPAASGSVLETLSPGSTVKDIDLDRGGSIWVAAGNRVLKYTTGGSLLCSIDEDDPVTALGTSSFGTGPVWVGISQTTPSTEVFPASLSETFVDWCTEEESPFSWSQCLWDSCPHPDDDNGTFSVTPTVNGMFVESKLLGNIFTCRRIHLFHDPATLKMTVTARAVTEHNNPDDRLRPSLVVVLFKRLVELEGECQEGPLLNYFEDAWREKVVVVDVEADYNDNSFQFDSYPAEAPTATGDESDISMTNAAPELWLGLWFRNAWAPINAKWEISLIKIDYTALEDAPFQFDPEEITLPSDGSGGADNTMLPPGFGGNVDPPFEVTVEAPDRFDCGDNTVTWTISDGINQETFPGKVIVEDTPTVELRIRDKRSWPELCFWPSWKSALVMKDPTVTVTDAREADTDFDITCNVSDNCDTTEIQPIIRINGIDLPTDRGLKLMQTDDEEVQSIMDAEANYLLLRAPSFVVTAHATNESGNTGFDSKAFPDIKRTTCPIVASLVALLGIVSVFGVLKYRRRRRERDRGLPS